eukprot:gene17244-biopygen1691
MFENYVKNYVGTMFFCSAPKYKRQGDLCPSAGQPETLSFRNPWRWEARRRAHLSGAARARVGRRRPPWRRRSETGEERKKARGRIIGDGAPPLRECGEESGAGQPAVRRGQMGSVPGAGAGLDSGGSNSGFLWGHLWGTRPVFPRTPFPGPARMGAGESYHCQSGNRVTDLRIFRIPVATGGLGGALFVTFLQQGSDGPEACAWPVPLPFRRRFAVAADESQSCGAAAAASSAAASAAGALSSGRVHLRTGVFMSEGAELAKK